MPAAPDASELADADGEAFDSPGLPRAAAADLAAVPPEGLLAGEFGLVPEEGPFVPLAAAGRDVGGVVALVVPEADADGPPVAGRDAGAPEAPGFPDAVGRAVPLAVVSAVPGAGVFVPPDAPVAGFGLGCSAEPPLLPAGLAGPDAGEFVGAEPGAESGVEGLAGRDVAVFAAAGPAGAVLASADSGAAEFAFLMSALPPGTRPCSPPRDAPACPDAEPFASVGDSSVSRGDAGAVHAAQVPGRRGG
ncbi:hypothetical protein AB0M45_01090 [Nocardia sp. NPDC051787]|uniref:hypothetical protein n=1 Tax=Nocardia sp. NPDC051787 TaxID=3155415 RepID=UPI0034458DD9